jgi:hypothetical protein
MATAELPLETFRDPAGSLRIDGNRVLRRVRPQHAEAALRFLQSDLAAEWVLRGQLIGTRFVTESDGSLTLEHPRVFFPTYPWEWTPAAWISAAELTLDLCQALLPHGLILKDATPLNILFEGSRPILVDVLSIDQRDPSSPLWLAYGQFVRTFLLPLVAYKFLGWPLASSIQKRDGYEPSDLAPYLSRLQRWREPFRSLVTMPLLLEKNAAAPNTAAIHQDPQVALSALQRNLAALRRHLRRLHPDRRATRWSGYTASADHYSSGDQEQKQRFVRESLSTIQPSHVLDLGANTGVFSRIAAACGASVVAWDTDIGATEENWRESRQQQASILPLIANPARPTPAAGWRNRESLALLDRARDRFDCVMMLGLIHHLLLSEQIPLAEIASLLRDLTTSWAIVEWVPATDPRFTDLVRGRESLYRHLTEPAFTAEISRHFTVVTREALPNGRVLFLLQAR